MSQRPGFYLTAAPCLDAILIFVPSWPASSAVAAPPPLPGESAATGHRDRFPPTPSRASGVPSDSSNSTASSARTRSGVSGGLTTRSSNFAIRRRTSRGGFLANIFRKPFSANSPYFVSSVFARSRMKAPHIQVGQQLVDALIIDRRHRDRAYLLLQKRHRQIATGRQPPKRLVRRRVIAVRQRSPQRLQFLGTEPTAASGALRSAAPRSTTRPWRCR